MLFSEFVYNLDVVCVKMVELMFEKYVLLVLFLVKSFVLSSFVVGKASSLVIDMGGKYMMVLVIYDGFVF